MKKTISSSDILETDFNIHLVLSEVMEHLVHPRQHLLMTRSSVPSSAWLLLHQGLRLSSCCCQVLFLHFHLKKNYTVKLTKHQNVPRTLINFPRFLLLQTLSFHKEGEEIFSRKVMMLCLGEEFSSTEYPKKHSKDVG